MHEQWQDMISFYVAGSLHPAQAAALEQHILGCSSCQQALAEWREVAEVVREEAAAWSKALPPLSADVRAAVYARRSAAQDAGDTGTSRPFTVIETGSKRRRTWGAVTLLAAVFTVIVFGGALIYMMSRGQNDDEANLTQVAMLAEVTETAEAIQATGTAESSPQPSPTRRQDDLGLFTTVPNTPQEIPASSTPQPPTQIPVVQPTQQPTIQPTPLPQGGGGGGEVEMSIAGSSEPSTLDTLNPNLCAISSGTGDALLLYRWPYTESGVIGRLEPGQSAVTYVQSGTGWYEVVVIGQGIVGWVPANQVVISGACDNLMLPTPTLPSVCLVTSNSGLSVNVRTGPGEQHDVVHSFSGVESVEAIARSDNQWYRVRFYSAGVEWLGWIPAYLVTASGPCDQLPVMLAQNYIEESTPVTTPTWTPTAETPPELNVSPVFEEGSSTGGDFSETGT